MMLFRLVSAVCLVMSVQVQVHAMSSDEENNDQDWRSISSRFVPFACSPDGQKSYWPASLTKSLSIDSDDEFSQARYESPRSPHILGGVLKSDRELLENLLRESDFFELLKELVQMVEQILKVDSICQDVEHHKQKAIQIFDAAVTKLDTLTQQVWIEILKQKFKEKKRGSSGFNMNTISDELWLAQKRLMARQINGVMKKMLEAFNIDSIEIDEIITEHQSKLASAAPLSNQNWEDVQDNF